ncbi:hypothetical protein H0I68_16085 [Yersinia kristensenii]|uniref:hypothetical protein n=1 Tax=Yersinia kristensenii TaxID=28152 RepID=UPI001C60B212|nr:hypothetical protein [Yersinia kristensenii]MBW5826562.1 hypothetical protein [Yersinia kristensenii]
MDITKSREEFEKWATEKFGDCIDISRAKNGDGGYMAWDVAFAWEAWKASRESVEVELPMRLSPCRSGYGYTLIPNDIGEALEYEQVVEKLHAQGIRIKGESE